MQRAITMCWCHLIINIEVSFEYTADDGMPHVMSDFVAQICADSTTGGGVNWKMKNAAQLG